MVYIITRDFDVCVFAVGGIAMDYKEMLVYLINEIEDSSVIEALFYIVQKIIGRGI